LGESGADALWEGFRRLILLQIYRAASRRENRRVRRVSAVAQFPLIR